MPPHDAVTMSLAPFRFPLPHSHPCRVSRGSQMSSKFSQLDESGQGAAAAAPAPAAGSGSVKKAAAAEKGDGLSSVPMASFNLSNAVSALHGRDKGDAHLRIAPLFSAELVSLPPYDDSTLPLPCRSSALVWAACRTPSRRLASTVV